METTSRARRTRSGQIQSENTARADAVRFAYEDGRLGTQAEIDADFPGEQSIFDDEGSVLTYEELGALGGLTQARFNEWVASDDYLAGPVPLEASAAKDRVAEQGWPDGCEDLKISDLDELDRGLADSRRRRRSRRRDPPARAAEPALAEAA